MTTGPKLLCDHIELRLPEPDDADELFELARDPQLSTYLQWPAHRTIDDSLVYIADTRSLWDRRIAYLPTVHDRRSHSLVGSIGLSGIDWTNRRAEVGTWIGRPYQGQGYNRLAKAAIFAFAFDLLGLVRLELLVRMDNDQSVRSMAHLPGVEHEGLLASRLRRDERSFDAHMFAITAARWNRSEWPDVTLPETIT